MSIFEGHQLTCATGVTTNAIILIAYGIGNAVGPFMWLKKYQPRNHVPWAVMVACSFACLILVLVLRYILSSENKRRKEEEYDDKYDNVFIVTADANGKETEKRVDKVRLLGLVTRRKDFIYLYLCCPGFP